MVKLQTLVTRIPATALAIFVAAPTFFVADGAWAQRVRLPQDPSNPTLQTCQALQHEYLRLVSDLQENQRRCMDAIDMPERWGKAVNYGHGGMCATHVNPRCFSFVDTCNEVQAQRHAARDRCNDAVVRIREREQQAARQEQERQRQAAVTRQRIESDQSNRKQAAQNSYKQQMDVFNGIIDKITRGSPPNSASRGRPSRPAADEDDEDEDNGRPTYMPQRPSAAEVAAERAAAQARSQATDRAAAQARVEAAERAAAQERAAKEQAAHAAERVGREESLYAALTRQVREANQGIRDAAAVISNPFDAALKMGSRQGTSSLMEGVAQATLPGATPSSDERLSRADDVVAVARTFGMAGNPFAQAVSARSTEGVVAIERRAVGSLDDTGRAIAGFGSSSGSSSGTPIPGSTTIRSLGEPSRAANPFEDAPRSAGAAVRFYDASRNQYVDVPEDHVLYRRVMTGPIRAVRNDATPERRGDRPELGEAGCSRDGVGLVTALCEAKRAAASKPFGK